MEYKKYLDESLSVEERAGDLVSRMTLEEKASQLKYDAPAIERLRLSEYVWWNEALHGVARAGTATVFPQAIGLAAIFDEEEMFRIADIISTEARAKYNAFSAKGDRGMYKGLTMWSPNINIFRDPRWGRGHETYGEDPFLTARLGVAFVKGMQGDGKHLKTAACAKHYAVHSGPEGERHVFDAVVSQKDLHETYLYAFEKLVKEAKVESIMGAYNRVNGEPCCASETLIGRILRGIWGFKGHFLSDCWAVRDFHTTHNITKTAPESAALAVKNGCDLNCGNTYLHLLQALQEGLITEEEIDISARRLMECRIRLGMLDESCEYDAIPYEKNDCKEHKQAALSAAKKSIVLLKNDGILPLAKDTLKSIAVVGPNADSVLALKGNYYGTASEYITNLSGLRRLVGENVRIHYAEGCHIYHKRQESCVLTNGEKISEAVTAAEHADIVILYMGLDERVEGEETHASNVYGSGDRDTLTLPGLQIQLIEEVCAVGKPVILVINSGSAVDLRFADEHPNIKAILQAWYSGEYGGLATAQLLLGEDSPSGRLPVTFYRSDEDLPDFRDYSMKGRTYRYFTGTPLYPFGYGLSYTAFDYSELSVKLLGEGLEASVSVINTKGAASDEVVQFYIKNNHSSLVPENPILCAFKRIHLIPGEKKTITVTISEDSLTVINANGERMSDGTNFTVYAGGSQPDQRSTELMGKKPLEVNINLC